MKKAILVAMFSLMMVSTAIAIPLLPGNFAVPTGAVSPGGIDVVSVLNVPFAGTDIHKKVWFTGTLSQWVKSNSTGLLFEYLFTNDSTSINYIKGLSTTDFAGWTTDVDSLKTTENSWPYMLARDPFGSTISAEFYWLAPGKTSSLLWIQTNAPSWKIGSTSLIDGGVVSVRTYAPAVPEPGGMMLLGTGLLGMIGYGKVRFGKKA